MLSFWKTLAKARMTRAVTRPGRAALAVESLEDRATPAAQQIIATAVEYGVAPVVHVFDAATGAEKFTVQAYEASFTGGGAVVKVFSGTDGRPIRSFFAGDETNRGGASVAAADFDGDGPADVVVGAIPGGRELVQVLKGTDGTVLRTYHPFDAPIEGVTVAAGDYNGDSVPDVVVGAGFGGGPRVTVLDGTDGSVLLNTFAFEPTARGGVQVAAGDLDDDGKAEVVAAPRPRRRPRVVAIQGGSAGTLLHSFFAYDDTAARNGVQVSVFAVDGDGGNDCDDRDGRRRDGRRVGDREHPYGDPQWDHRGRHPGHLPRSRDGDRRGRERRTRGRRAGRGDGGQHGPPPRGDRARPGRRHGRLQRRRGDEQPGPHDRRHRGAGGLGRGVRRRRGSAAGRCPSERRPPAGAATGR